MKKILLPHQYYYPHMDLFLDKSSVSKEAEFFQRLESDTTERDAMIYVHIPFCDSKCSFCGFDKVYNLSEIEQYKRMLIEEIRFFSSKKYVQSLKFSGIHFGGGTPTLLPKQVLSEMIDAVRESFHFEKPCTLNIEGSATTLYKDEIIELIKEKDVSRVSVGAQTFYQRLRDEYKSKATLEEVYLTLRKLGENGIAKYIDIMYGYPDFGIGDMEEIVLSDLKTAADLNVEGVDFGQLYPFSNPLEKRVADEHLSFAGTEKMTELILHATSFLKAAGYTQKTAYAFTKQGEIIIETSYFGGVKELPDCLALGSGAFGFLNGYKYRNTSYNSYLNRNALHFSQLKRLTDYERTRMNIVGFPKLLRLSKRLLTDALFDEYESRLGRFKADGLLEETAWEYILTDRGKCLIDNLYYEMLDDREKSKINSQVKVLTLA